MTAQAGGTQAGIEEARAWLRNCGAFSERTLSEKFARDFGDSWRFNQDEGKWLQWVGTHWARGQTPEFMESLGVYAAGLSRLFFAIGEITKAEMGKFHAQRTVASMERICRSMPSFTARSALFDADSFLLGTPGGTVDLRTGELWAAEPEDYITILTAVTPAPAGTPAPRWLTFLDEVTGSDAGLIRTLQQWAGCGATGSTRDHKLLFLYGSGRNGKGVYCRVLAGLLGAHAAGAPRDLFMEQRNQQHPTALVRVALSRSVFAAEIPEGASWDATLIKELTGGDAVEIRRMKQDFFPVTPLCSITIQGNEKPALKTVDAAIRDRFMLATFPTYIPPERQIADFDRILLAAEGPAILRWIIDGAVDRETSGRLYIADTISADTSEYMADADLMAAFIDEHLNRDDPAREVETKEVFDLYVGFCRAAGVKPPTKIAFTSKMKNSGIKHRKSHGKAYFSGVYLKSEG
jgi:putative DNA primase/helicase